MDQQWFILTRRMTTPRAFVAESGCPEAADHDRQQRVDSRHKVRRKACFNIWSKTWGIVESIGPAFAGCALPQRKENAPCKLILMR